MKLTLKQYQQIDKINSNKSYDDLDKVLFSVCVLNNMTEQQLDALDARTVDRMCRDVSKQMSAKVIPAPADKMGEYFIDYNCDNLRFAQYVELQFFLHHGDPLHNCHSILASIAHKEGLRNTSQGHRERAAYFLNQPITVCLGSMQKFIEAFAEFNSEFKNLFGLDESVVGPNAMINAFNKRYGWTYAVTRVKEYESITLDEAYDLSARQALNDLTYLKALDKYIDELNKQR